MLSRRLATARPLSHLLRNPITHHRTQTRHLNLSQGPKITAIPHQFRDPTQEEIDDPNMNGGYINPPRIRRQFRDPYGDWWDKQERRNFGEPVHEDNDILGMFSPEEYTHFTPGWGAVCLGIFVATFLGVVTVVGVYYPDMPSVKRGYEGGLDRELGGEGAVPVSNPSRCCWEMHDG